MGGRGGKGRNRTQHMPKDPILPPDATARPDEPENPDEAPTEQGDRERQGKPNPGQHIPDLEPPTYTGPPPATDAEIEAHVIDTARSFERSPGDYVNLANVRAALHPDLDRATVDAAMQRINRRQGAVFVSDDAQESMTQPERDAALRIGNQANHLISFEDYH